MLSGAIGAGDASPRHLEVPFGRLRNRDETAARGMMVRALPEAVGRGSDLFQTFELAIAYEFPRRGGGFRCWSCSRAIGAVVASIGRPAGVAGGRERGLVRE